MYAQSQRASCSMLGGRRSGHNEALEQTRDSVLLYGESVGCELLNFVVTGLDFLYQGI
jgi:hypothetical protein